MLRWQNAAWHSSLNESVSLSHHTIRTDESLGVYDLKDVSLAAPLGPGYEHSTITSKIF
jgi:hypothetical protein